MSTTPKPGTKRETPTKSPKKTPPKSAVIAASPGADALAAADASDKPAPVSAAPTTSPFTVHTADPSAGDAAQPVILGPVMRKKELVDAVVARSGVKKRDAKPVIEAALDVLGEALADSRELILPPLGRFVVRKQRQNPNGRVITLKLRQSSGPDREDRDDPDEN